ncbi:MAG: D-glycerate dehydrogenase [Planctomycetes bacterium]|nr:D-glycerate dehydrogenase [Planctomycetota bacterium]
MSRCRVLVTRYVYPAALELLRRHTEVDYRDSRDGLARDALTEALRSCAAVVCQLTDRIDADLLDAAPELRLIANVAVGYDNIDVGAATARGIVVTNTPGVLTESTADLAFALLLAVGRRVGEAERWLRAGNWRQWEIDLLCGREVHGATLGILGMGRIGQAVARRARGFAMEVLYHSRRQLPESTERELGARFVTRAELFAAADFVSLHLPLDATTRGSIGAAELRQMKSTACLINTARGGLVDDGALLAALREGTLAGAGLDVFPAEPEVDPGYLELENVVLLPHIGSASVATRTRMCLLAAESVVAWVRGEVVPRQVGVEG